MATMGGERLHTRASVILFTALALAALGAVVLTWNWGNYHERLRAMHSASARNGSSVDTRPLDAAEQLAPLAESRSEKSFAEQALRLADYSVDFAFAAALQDAVDSPTPLTPETRAIAARRDSATAAVAADQKQIATLTDRAAKSGGHPSDDLQQQLDLAKAQLELDQDLLDDAHQDLARAGGDKRASIQQLRDQHEASEHTPGPSATAPGVSGVRTPAAAALAASATPSAGPSIELTKSTSIVAQMQAWSSLDAKQTLLVQARENATGRAEKFSGAHDALEGKVSAERAQNSAHPTLDALKELTVNQTKLSSLDHRIDTEQSLATVYADWSSFVSVRQQAFLHGIFLAAFWVFFITLVVMGANIGLNRVFSGLVPDRRQLHTLRTILLFAMQAIGLLLILVTIFGAPGNVGTVLAVIGAGLTVALQGFIIGFLGWFVLMGKDGMRPGDWVEINGVDGEVLHVGVFKTVLLETGNWTESATPTGRKVTFVNSFAIQGHYFNFSTSGQWLWDELQVQVAEGIDPYAVADAIQKIAAKEIEGNASVAEEEWRRVVPSYATQSFSAQPTVRVLPIGPSVGVVLRYLSRASERQATRAKLYRALIELAQGKEAHLAVATSPTK